MKFRIAHCQQRKEKKRDQALMKEKGKEVLESKEKTVNVSLSYFGISNRRKVILGKAKKA